MISIWQIYKLQQTEQEIEKIGKQTAELDPGGHILEKIEESKRRVEETKAELHKSRLSLKKSELELEGLLERKKELEKKLYSGKTSNPKELSQWQRELESTEEVKRKTEDKTLSLMEALENREKEIARLESELSALKATYEEHHARYQEELKQLESAMKSLKERRERLIQSISPEMLKKYEELRARKDGIAVARVVKGNCGGCHMNLSEAKIRRVHERQLEFCGHCGRILFADGE